MVASKARIALREIATRPKQALRELWLSGLLEEACTGRNGISPVNARDVAGSAGVSVRLADFSQNDGNVSIAELSLLAYFVASSGARRILEIGTFDGRTARHLAMNAADDAEVYTLDLPPESSGTALRTEELDTPYIANRGKRSWLEAVDPLTIRKIHVLHGDSATFDFQQYGPFDLAFIDGSHSYEYCRNDTKKVLDRLSPGGTVVWHDYPVWPGVRRCLSEVAARRKLQWIIGTSLVVYSDRPTPPAP